eukprot:TRINITY_DN28687_c0_g5_i2.p1 TRINITY_DN28687_c0_g5~~TRINITY_DN28687_c0_g5_i2.p1  ORF type:complete len:657 (-),score=133.08 TRINITY_DN28687_c0_g5_i2:90-2060(-)
MDPITSSTPSGGGARDGECIEENIHRITSKAVFYNTEDMKKDIREKMIKPKYDVSDFYKTEGLAQRMARHTYFETGTLVVICLNAVWISIDADYNSSDTLVQAPIAFQVIENMFCTFFVFEWLVRFTAFRRTLDCVRDSWFVFDSVLATAIVLETWVMTVFVLTWGVQDSRGVRDISILRMARLLKITRIARLARLVRAFPELMIMIQAMIAGFRSVLFTLVLLCFLIYTYAIAFRQLMDGTPMGKLYFSSVPNAFHVLLVQGTFLDEVASLSHDLSQSSSPGIFLLFWSFVMLSALTLMNMLIGVLVEVVQAVAYTEKEAMTINYVKDRLERIYQQVSLSDNVDAAALTKDQFLVLISDKFVIKVLDEVGVDTVGLVDFVDFLFEPEEDVDEDGDTIKVERMLTFGEFVEFVMQLRGSNTCSVKDVVDLRKFVSLRFANLEEKLRNDRRAQRPSGIGSMSVGSGLSDLGSPHLALRRPPSSNTVITSATAMTDGTAALSAAEGAYELLGKQLHVVFEDHEREIAERMRRLRRKLAELPLPSAAGGLQPVGVMQNGLEHARALAEGVLQEAPWISEGCQESAADVPDLEQQKERVHGKQQEHEQRESIGDDPVVERGPLRPHERELCESGGSLLRQVRGKIASASCSGQVGFSVVL